MPFRREGSFGVTYGLGKGFKYIFHSKYQNYFNLNNIWELSEWLEEDQIKVDPEFTRHTGKPKSAIPIRH